MSNQFSDTHVKILVHTERVDGYPPEEWESMWAIPLGSGLFKVDNIPFFAKNLSCDDIVEANVGSNGLLFSKVIRPSTNSTIRVIMYNLDDEDDVRSRLNKLGCSIEGSGTAGLMAVNVPKANIDKVLDFLEEAFGMGLLDFEEGAIR